MSWVWFQIRTYRSGENLPGCLMFRTSPFAGYQELFGSWHPEQNLISPFVSNYEIALVCALKGQVVVSEKESSQGTCQLGENGGWKAWGMGALPGSAGDKTCSLSLTHHLDSGRKDLTGYQSDPIVPPQPSKASTRWEEMALDSCWPGSHPVPLWSLWPPGAPITLLCCGFLHL